MIIFLYNPSEMQSNRFSVLSTRGNPQNKVCLLFLPKEIKIIKNKRVHALGHENAAHFM